jgi:hypothetical protein
MRVNHKLVFVLCIKCAETNQQTKCKHTDEERALEGAWCTPELHHAVKRGYRVLKISEVWQYNEWATGAKDGLFAGYINAWLKRKQEASGWPSWCQTDEDKEQYKRQYLEREGVQLENVESNPSMRYLSKLFLNRQVV